MFSFDDFIIFISRIQKCSCVAPTTKCLEMSESVMGPHCKSCPLKENNCSFALKLDGCSGLHVWSLDHHVKELCEHSQTLNRLEGLYTWPGEHFRIHQGSWRTGVVRTRPDWWWKDQDNSDAPAYSPTLVHVWCYWPSIALAPTILYNLFRRSHVHRRIQYWKHQTVY